MLYAKQNTIAGFHLYADHILRFLESTPAAQPLLERFGYTVPRMQEGRALLEQAKAAYQTVQGLRETQKEATKTLHWEWKVLRRRYQVQSQTARRLLKEEMPVTVTAKARGYSRWVNEAQGFYAAILRNPAHLEKLSQVSITPEELARSAQLIQELLDRKNSQTVSRRSVRAGHLNRQQQQEAAKVWFQELLRVAPLAFRDHPEIQAAMEALAPRPLQTVKRLKKKIPAKVTGEAGTEVTVVTG